MSEHLDPATDRSLRRIVALRQRSGRVPSIAAALIRDGNEVWSGACGAGAHPAAAYRIGSITKSLTAVLVLQAMADGLVETGTSVREVLGDAAHGAVGDVTVGELLSHSAGLPAEPMGPWWERAGRSDSFAELVADNAGAAPVFAPGIHFHYSNLGFAWLGEVVARVRTTTWWEATRRRLLEPLGMSATSFDPDADAVTGWSVDPYTGEVRAEPASTTGAMAPAGQLWSTVGDLGRWAGFLCDGNVEILPDEWLARARTPRSGLDDQGLSFAYGWGLQMFPGIAGGGAGAETLVGHLGSMPGFQAALMIDRPRRTAVVCLGNATVGLDPLSLARELLTELERLEPAIPAPWIPTVSVPDEVRELVGLWYWGTTPYRMTWDGASLALGAGSPLSRWQPVADGDGMGFLGVSGYHAGERLVAVRNPDGTVNHLDASTFILTRAPYDPAAPIPGEPD